MNITVVIERIDSDVPLPSRGRPSDASYDLHAVEEVFVQPGERVQVPTGIRMHLPEGYAALIWDRSSMSHKHGFKTLGGVIDEGFRGEVKVGLINLDDKPYTIKKHDRVAQMILQKIENVTLIEGEVSTDTARGENAFGSTGK